MTATYPPLHQDLTFLAPLSEERAARLVGFLGDASPETVLDVGCGWGELLLRVLDAVPSATERSAATSRARRSDSSSRPCPSWAWWSWPSGTASR